MPSYVTLFLGVTYNRCATYKFTIHQIGTHVRALNVSSRCFVFDFVWLVVNSSVTSKLLSLFFSSNRSLLSLLFQGRKTFHVEEPRLTQQLPLNADW